MASAANDDYAKVDNYAAYSQSLTKADKAAIAEKEASCAMLAVENADAGQAAVLRSLPNFRMYQQQTSYYCVPACIQSALMYLAKKSPSQAAIHNYTQLNFTRIPAYMNARQNKCRYALVNNPSLAVLKNRIYQDIVSKKAPVFLRIAGTNTRNWYYSTNGHCILATGIYTDRSRIRLGDPLGNRVKGCPVFYTKTSTIVKQYTTHMCW
jgi:hypothetical protein